MARYALVIGISQYSSSHLKKLPKAAADAEEVAKVLETYGDFQVERLPKKWNEDTKKWEVTTTKSVTKDEIITELQQLLWERGSKSEVLIYFAGHGVRVFDDLDDPQGFLAVSDFQIKFKGSKVVGATNGISLDIINRLIAHEQCNISRLVMVLDCCHSGSLLENQEIRKTLTVFGSETDYYLMAACRSFENARSLKGEINSIFTGAFIKGLSVENANPDGTVTTDIVFNVINNELKDSGQEPIRMGGGRSITLVQDLAKNQPAHTIISEECPYQGLRYFTESTAPYFFGRKKVIGKLKQKLEEVPFVAVIGNSGSGKSSVVRAGLIPLLKEESNWQILEPILPSINPLEKLKHRLKEEIFYPLLHDEPEELSQVYDLIDNATDINATDSIEAVILKLPSSERFLLLVDQFEEVFTLCSEEKKRERFIQLLTQVAGILASRLIIVITIRADFVANCLNYESLTKLIEKQAVYMPPLTKEDLIEIIVNPAEIQGYRLEKGLQEFILDDVLKERECLPLLEFTLQELWQPATEQEYQLKINQYLNLGRVSGALEQHADKIYAEIGKKFGQEGQEWFKRICLSLIRTGTEMKDTRQRKPKAEILALAGKKREDKQVIAKILERLIDGRLLVTGEEGSKPRGAWVDLSHEALIEGWKQFVKWREDVRDLRRLSDRVRDDRKLWEQKKLDAAYLLTGGLLEQVREQWRQLEPLLIPEDKDFYKRSISEDRRLKSLSARTKMSKEAIMQDFTDNLFYLQGKNHSIATLTDYYYALAYTVRDRLLERFLKTEQTYQESNVKVISYLSTEFLMGRHLANNLISLDMYDTTSQGLSELPKSELPKSSLDLEKLIEQEPDPGLGSAGFGRLAACFLDSLANLEMPAIGYGIRYEFGIFRQVLEDGWQGEVPDNWLMYGNPWEIPRPEYAVEISLGGHTEGHHDQHGHYRVSWIPDGKVKAIPFDTPVPGYKSNTVNALRLWKAEASEEFNFEAFNEGNYYRAVAEKMSSETISKVLYPNAHTPQGKELRLKQQYFFVSASLQDLIRRHLRLNDNLDNFQDLAAIQLNDTHPAVAVAELMRLFVDEHNLDWDKAWNITQRTLSYTNHSLRSTVLEKWSVSLFSKMLPRHLEIIYELNHRFLEDVRTWFPNDNELIAQLSMIQEGKKKKVRMANLACVGSHAINGVAALHTELLKKDKFKAFARLWPEKFFNKTNGVTPRRWILQSNPKLAALIKEKIGDGWVKDLDQIREIEQYIDDPEFCKRWREIKQDNKADLALYIKKTRNIDVDVNSIFDVQVKYINEYKRQHLAILNIIAMYNSIKQNPDIDVVARTFIFAGKAAPEYSRGKLIIKLINSVAEVINGDPDVRGKIKVVFLTNFNVSLGEKIYPAADLSEQISTPGKEASGTGNMKFAMNGALTIGTLDGANIEIREEVGKENFFQFGLTAEEVYQIKAEGYDPMTYYESNQDLRGVLDRIARGDFSHGNEQLFKPIINSLESPDEYMLLADYQAYIDCQKKVSQVYLDKNKWTRMSILNVARMGKFSSDRTIKEYCIEIWNIKPVPINIHAD